jgi:hypothetical protein
MKNRIFLQICNIAFLVLPVFYQEGNSLAQSAIQAATYTSFRLFEDDANFGYSDLNSIKKIKFVPQCKAGIRSEKYVFIEYLINKIFRVKTDTSFKAGLLTLNYIDSENKKKPFTQYEF